MNVPFPIKFLVNYEDLPGIFFGHYCPTKLLWFENQYETICEVNIFYYKAGTKVTELHF